MRALLLLVAATLTALVVWVLLILIGTLDGWWREPLAPRNDTRAFFEALRAEIDATPPGNLAMRLIEDGRVAGEHFTSIGKPVDAETLFQVASLSKWITAWGVMTLVENGRLDLDAPVRTYLTRWSLPASAFDNDGVTVRRLLSHTAGLTDDLGYAGVAPGTEVQALTDSLTRAADASPGKDGRVRVGVAPGSEFRYSGGGYTLLQLLIEEVTGTSFEDHMQRAVLRPLGMSRSTFSADPDTTPNVATSYDVDGGEAVHYRFASLAAASLYTNVDDLTRFLDAHRAGAAGEPVGRGVLKPETVQQMQVPHASQFGADIWGLGTMLYVPTDDGGFLIGHDGNNEPAINTAARLDPATGDGIIVLETGSPLLATRLAGEWVFWQTGKLDTLAFLMVADRTLTLVVIGWIVLVLIAVAIGWRMARARAST